ncbi:YdcH family protein [Glacieibacterium sp.]|uniref:YdcH family protein n=1 Tax=Glacieibacterium sp. TaxID=2860237 RepID=UPI003B01001B
MPNGHFASLAARHALLDTSLSQEGQRPLPDSARIAELKREKLRLKEEMSRQH